VEVRVAFYLVERYVPSLSAAELVAAMARLDDLPEPGVRHVWTILVADEDTCLSVFEGPDPATVEAANRRASFPLDRIVEISPLGAAEVRAGRGQGSVVPRMRAPDHET
jgi:hypothetical protein